MKNTTQLLSEIRQGVNEEEILEQILEPLWEKSNDGFKLDELTEIEKYFIHIQNTAFSIRVGGINSLFYNNAGKLACEAEIAYKAIEDQVSSEIIKQSIAAFPIQPIPQDLETCRQIMESLPDENEADEKWNELSDQFYEHYENSVVIQLNFIQENRELFQ